MDGDGAGNIDDDLRWRRGGSFVDGLKAAEDVAEGVRNDGGAARREAALGDENDEIGERSGDLLRSLEGGMRAGAEEIGGEVAGVVEGIRSFTYVDEAVAGGGVLDGKAAAAVGARAVTAAVGAASRGGQVVKLLRLLRVGSVVG